MCSMIYVKFRCTFIFAREYLNNYEIKTAVKGLFSDLFILIVFLGIKYLFFALIKFKIIKKMQNKVF